jgi:kynurenine 3-monooxygenase
MSSQASKSVVVIGAGLAGSLMAILLARRGHHVQLYERLADLRREPIPAGRSINLALAARGIRALEAAGVMRDVEPLLLPMVGRMIHDASGGEKLAPYGQRPDEVIYSVSRSGLNRILLDAAEQAGVEIRFRHAAIGADFVRGQLRMRDEGRQREYELPLVHTIGADGAGSALRRSLVAAEAVPATEDLLAHGYKELTMPALAGKHAIANNALHIWPRGGFMLIALPNLDGSFTVTLFLPHEGPESFASLVAPGNIDEFFRRCFPDARRFMPQLAQEFLARPIGIMGTVRCAHWSAGDRLLLIGDAAHAITPFHGQGMNCAFEDCRELDDCLMQRDSWQAAFIAFERRRHLNTDAIADMALENYIQMRDTVLDPMFQLQQSLAFELERRFPDRFIPRYSMIMFRADIPYVAAYDRGRLQSAILNELTQDATSLADIDYDAAARLIRARLPPI